MEDKILEEDMQRGRGLMNTGNTVFLLCAAVTQCSLCGKTLGYKILLSVLLVFVLFYSKNFKWKAK